MAKTYLYSCYKLFSFERCRFILTTTCLLFRDGCANARTILVAIESNIEGICFYYIRFTIIHYCKNTLLFCH